jgi:hypothetical protein
VDSVRFKAKGTTHSTLAGKVNFHETEEFSIWKNLQSWTSTYQQWCAQVSVPLSHKHSWRTMRYQVGTGQDFGTAESPSSLGSLAQWLCSPLPPKTSQDVFCMGLSVKKKHLPQCSLHIEEAIVCGLTQCPGHGTRTSSAATLTQAICSSCSNLCILLLSMEFQSSEGLQHRLDLWEPEGSGWMLLSFLPWGLTLISSGS